MRFNSGETSIIYKADPTKPMYVYQNSIRNDSILLHKKSLKIKPDSLNKDLSHLINRMYTTVLDTVNPGVGIAAPQVGINRRIIWVQRFDKETQPFEVYLNAAIRKYSLKTSERVEGCLSLKGLRGPVMRSDTIWIEYDRLDKKHYREEITGFTAIIFQHEIDHLNGIVYTDRIKDRKRIITEAEYQKVKKQNKK
jgi:peptide deformylase